jgi:hypothetical protein
MVQFGNDKTCTMSSNINRLLQREAGNGLSMEEWLFKQFPKGMNQLALQYEKEAKPYQESVGKLTDRSEFCDMAFDHPLFDQEYTRAEHICKQDGYGVRIEAFDALEAKKNLHDKVLRQRVFFERELFPRLRELKEGAPTDRYDLELFKQAKEYAQPIASQYNEKVAARYKPQAGS